MRAAIGWLGAALLLGQACASSPGPAGGPGDKPVAAYQIPQAKLAEMATRITHGQLMAWRLGRLKDDGRLTPAQVSMAKRNNCEIALDITREARDILGANGITGEYPVMRHMCNLESVKTYEGTHNIHTLVLGEAVTGIAAYR